ncbi:MAG: hypothetical protein LUM44_24105 [Pyrinomonadaceae bacterium]|nr:hypothetical protein [Pyrinomonadaceae bacterium]
MKMMAVSLLICGIFSACGNSTEDSQTVVTNTAANANAQVVAEPAPNSNSEKAPTPNLQAEILDDRNKTTVSPLGKFDFKNFEYELPRGWQDSDGNKAVLENGIRRMTEEPKKIGLAYVTTKFMDVTGDGQDEAFVILKITTGGSAIPQVVYIYEWKDEQPELLWFFRTGDRADGGLKDLRVENGELIVEIFGQDRYILGEGETRKLTGDDEQICCPTYFTRSVYKWNGKSFPIQGKRLTYSTTDKNAPPRENVIEIFEKENGGKK